MVNFQKTPLVSVVMPVFNNEDTIDDALNSILSQDYTNLEVIIINDGSTDDSKNILSKYGEKIKIIDQKNSGSAVARSQGINRANGKYVAFIDADDIWVPWKISAQIHYLEAHDDVGMVFNTWLEIHDETDRLPSLSPSEFDLEVVDELFSGWIYTKLLMDCVVHTSSVVISKTLCEKIGNFDSNLRRGQDYDYWLRASQLTKITKLKSVLSAYRFRQDSITNKMSNINYEAIVLEKAFKAFGLSDAVGNNVSTSLMEIRLANCWRDFCWRAFYSKNYILSLRSSLKIIEYKPLWYLGWAYLVISIVKFIYDFLFNSR